MEERTYVRTLYGRSDGSDVITKPKFLAVMGLPNSLSYGAPLARALRRARELRYNDKIPLKDCQNAKKLSTDIFAGR